MLHSYLLGLSGLHPRFNVEERLVNRAGLSINFLLGDEGLGGESKLILIEMVGTLCSTSTTKKTGRSVYFRKTSLI